jgi:hypothetical protein
MGAREFSLPVRLVGIGALAHTALCSDAAVRPVPQFADAPYALVGDTLVWAGTRVRAKSIAALDRLSDGNASSVDASDVDATPTDTPPAVHPRMVLLDAAPDGSVAALLNDPLLRAQVKASATPALPIIPRIDRTRAAALLSNWLPRLLATHTPRGFGRALAGQPLLSPLDLAGTRLQAFANALRTQDTQLTQTTQPAQDREALIATARKLIGLGGGFTPSGDDLVSAALFAMRCTAPAENAHSMGVFNDTSRTLIAAAHTLTHPISATLFADTANGHTYPALQAFARGVADEHFADAQNALSMLDRIGHSSGWDMLTGFVLAFYIPPFLEQHAAP